MTDEQRGRWGLLTGVILGGLIGWPLDTMEVFGPVTVSMFVGAIVGGLSLGAIGECWTGIVQWHNKKEGEGQ